MKRACVYVRVSSEKQVDGYSLDSQEEICKKEAERQGFEMIKVFREEGISGTTLDRPQLEELLTFVKNKENNIHAVVVYHTSRLSRDTLDFLTLKSYFAKYGITLISTTEPIAGDSPEQKFLSTIMAATNQLENEIRGRNVANSLRKRFLEGHITSKPPIGYLMQKVNGKSIAVKDTVWFPIIKDMWRRVEIERLSMAQTAKELNKLKMRRFTRGSVEKIFKNKFYCGILTSLKYGEAKGQHEPMIDENTYFRVQAMYKSRQFPGVTRTRLREDFMLRFILRCENCENKLTSAWSKGKCKKYAYYFCIRCDKRQNFPKDKVESRFIELLREIKPQPEAIQYYMELLKEEYDSQYTKLSTSHDWVKQEVEKLEENLKTLEEKHLGGIYNDDDYVRIRDGIKVKIMQKRSVLAEKRLDIVDIEAMTNFLKFYLDNIDIVFTKSNPEARLRIACSIFPNGLVFDGLDYRTPEIAPSYKHIKQFEASMPNSVSRQGLEP